MIKQIVFDSYDGMLYKNKDKQNSALNGGRHLTNNVE